MYIGNKSRMISVRITERQYLYLQYLAKKWNLSYSGALSNIIDISLCKDRKFKGVEDENVKAD